MKYCPRFYNHLYLSNFSGGMSVCPWIRPEYACIGNLNNDTIESAYNSEHANLLRASMDDQTFRYCSSELCPFIQGDMLEEVPSEEYERRKCVSYMPTVIDLSYDFCCTQNCESCRASAFVPPIDCTEKFFADKILPILNQAERVSVSGQEGPFASAYMMDLLEKLHPVNPDFRLILGTDGAFFNVTHWERIKHLTSSHLEIVVTVNSFNEFIYKHISRNGNFQKMLAGLEFMSQLRDAKKISCVTGLVETQDRNFREIPEILKRCFDVYAFDHMILRTVSCCDAMKEESYWFKNVQNPMNPYHTEYLQIMEEPLLKDPRVHFFGKMVTEPRPYPLQDMEKHTDSLFPYEAVRRGSRIVLYGAGEVGQKIVQTLGECQYCSSLLWIDQRFNNEAVLSPNCLLNLPHSSYDYIILATLNPLYELEMRSTLRDMGISGRQVLSCRRGSRIIPISWIF